MTTDCGRLWYTEDDPTHGTHYHSISSILYSGRTTFHDVLIIDTEEWGRTLILDGDIQSTETDEPIFHEALVHPVMLAHACPKSVLILGSGEGATLREALSYASVERAVMADVDEELVEICTKYLPEWSEGSFDEANVELVFEDGADYLEGCRAAFDVIIADMVDCEDGASGGPSAGDMVRRLRQALAAGGMLAVHGLELDPFEHEAFVAMRSALQRVFPVVRAYSTHIPSLGGESAFLIASDGPDPAALAKDEIDKRLRERGIGEDRTIADTLVFYDADAHHRMFNLPKNMKAMLSDDACEGEGHA